MCHQEIMEGGMLREKLLMYVVYLSLRTLWLLIKCMK